MQRSILQLAAVTRPQVAPLLRHSPIPPHLPPMPPAATAFASTTSAPKEAEEASAQSGGSRSKDFKESAEQNDTGSELGTTKGDVKDARGRTGGGEPLKSSDHAPPQPKIWNASVPPEKENLTDAQKEEVNRHNKEFAEKHDKASTAGEDKVNKNFWSSDSEKSVKK